MCNLCYCSYYVTKDYINLCDGKKQIKKEQRYHHL